MKKITRSLLLTATLFSLVACGTPESNVNSTNNDYLPGANHEPSTGNYDITYTKDDAVTITGPSSATKGSKVTFTISYDSSVYTINSVTVNNELPFSEGNNKFTFKMPEEAVSVRVTGKYNDPTHGKVKINNVNKDKGVVLFGADEYVAPGETVRFQIKFAYNSPYSFTGKVSITKGDDPVDVSFTNNEYSFVMPNEEVSVDVELEANLYRLTIGSSEKNANFASSPFATKVTTTDEFTNVTGESFGSYYYGRDYTTYHVPYGQEIRVKVRKSSDRVSNMTGVRLSGSFDSVIEVDNLTPVVDEDYYYGYFQMPADDFEVTAYGTMNYKGIEVINSAHYNATLQCPKDVDIQNVDEILPGDVIYVKISSVGEPGEDYVFNGITVNGVSSYSVYTDEEGKLYHFTMPNRDDVSVTVNEKDMTKYKGQPFLGTHFGANIAYEGPDKSISVSDSHQVVITGDGEITKGTGYSASKYTIGSINLYNENSFGVMTTTDSTPKDIAYSGKFLFGHYSFSTGYSGGFGTDWHVSVLAEAGDTKANYKFYYRTVKTSFLAVQAYRIVDSVETPYANMIYDIVNKEIYSNDVTFEFSNGVKVSDASAAYNVMIKNQVIATVTDGTSFTNLIPHPQTIVPVGSTHYSVQICEPSFYEPIADLTSINAGQTIVAALTPKDIGDGAVEDENFEYDSLIFTDEEGNPVDVAVNFLEKNRYYSFKMPKTNVTMTVKERNPNPLKDHDLVGNYIYKNIYKTSTGYSQSSGTGSSGYTIDQKGNFNKMTKTVINEVSSQEGDGYATFKNGNQFFYGNKFIVGDYGLDTTKDKIGSDLDVFIKMQEATDTNNMYKFYYLIVYNGFMAVQVTRTVSEVESMYACAFFDIQNKEFYGTGLSFEFTGDKDKLSEATSFIVKVGSNTIGTVTDRVYTKA